MKLKFELTLFNKFYLIIKAAVAHLMVDQAADMEAQAADLVAQADGPSQFHLDGRQVVDLHMDQAAVAAQEAGGRNIVTESHFLHIPHCNKARR